MVPCHYYECVVVDEEMPMDRWHEDEEVYNVLAKNKAHAKLAVTIVIGSRYKVVDFTMDREITDADEYERNYSTMETDKHGLHNINAFDALDGATLQASFRGVDGDRHEHRAETLDALRTWYREHPQSAPDADHPEKTRARYRGAPETDPGTGYRSTFQTLSTLTVAEYLDEQTPEPAA